MGFVFSKIEWIWTPADYDTPDGSTGLTPREKDIVQRTWKMVRADLKNNGVKLFLKFFEQFPEYQLLFKAFANVPLQDMATNSKVRGHATSVVYAINSVVDNLEDLECLVELLNKIGTSHRPRNLTALHFQNLAGTFLIFLEDVLGEGIMNSREKEAWTKTLEVANNVIIKALEERDT